MFPCFSTSQITGEDLAAKILKTFDICKKKEKNCRIYATK